MSQPLPLVSMVTAVLPPDIVSEDYLTFEVSMIIEKPIVVQSLVRIIFVYDASIPLPLLLRKLDSSRSDARKSKSKEPPFKQGPLAVPQGFHLPTLVYRFDLEFSQKYSMTTIRAAIVPLPNISPVGSGRLSIAYDWIQRFDPENQHFSAVFQSNWAIQFVDLHRFQELATIGETRYLPRPTCRARFDIRIFVPNKLMRKPSRVIPSSIALRIGDYLIEDLQRAWRKPLLNFGLVSKSTSCVLCLFFEVQREEHEISDRADKPPLLPSVRSLQWKPERAHGISYLYPGFYSVNSFPGDRGDGSHLVYYEAFFLLISLSQRVKHIVLPQIPASLYPKLVSALASIREVESLDLERSLWSHGWAFRDQDVFQLLSLWPRLRGLSACILSGDDSDIDNGVDEKGVAPSCNLESLMLAESKLGKTHLLRFLPCEGSPKLRKLMLSKVGGIENDVLRQFLHAVAKTLESIHITGCIVVKDGSRKLAFDDAMPQLTVLKSLSIGESGNIVGVRCICARKNRIPGSEFSVINADPFKGKEVLKALKSSSWDRISVLWDSPKQQKEAQKVAKSQGITFKPELPESGRSTTTMLHALAPHSRFTRLL